VSVTRARLADWGLGVLLGIVCAVAIFPSVIFGGRSLLGGFLREDPAYAAGFPDEPVHLMWDASAVMVHYPAALVAAAELREGRLPLWNPYVGTGLPLLAEAHSAPLSPLFLPFLLWPSQASYSWCMVLCLVLAAAATFVCARRFGQGHAGAVIAAVTYAIGGCAMARFDLPTEGAAHAMLPLCVLAADRALRGGSIAWLGVAVGVTWLVAHPVVAALCVGGAALLAVARGGRELPWGRVIAGVALGMLLAALVLLPFAVYLFAGENYKLTPQQAQDFGSDFLYLQVVPDLLRFGAGPLLLAAFAVFRGLGPSARAGLVALILVGGLFLVHGVAPPPWNWLVVPKYAVFVLVFAVALLAGEGVDHLERRRLLPALALTALLWVGADLVTHGGFRDFADVVAGDTTAACVVVLAVLFPRWRPLVPVVVALGFVLSARRSVGPVPDSLPRTPLVDAVAALRAEVPPRIVGLGAMHPNTSSTLGVADVRAVAAIFPPRYRAYMALVEGATLYPTSVLVTAMGSPLLDLAGVGHVLSADGLLPNLRVAPRVLVPATLLAAASREEAARSFPKWSPTTAVVEAPIGELARRQGGRATAEIALYQPGRVEIDVVAEGHALVVLTDTWDRGWYAEVDGDGVPIWPTDVLFRGVPVPPGPSRLVLTYQPAPALWGAALSGLTALGVLGVALVGVWRRRAVTA
jgi:hypothetical protein